jgi:hypothetical protein
VEWLTQNVEEPANKHFIQDYRLYGPRGRGSRDGTQAGRTLEDLGASPDDEAFRQYVQGEVKSYLEKRS